MVLYRQTRLPGPAEEEGEGRIKRMIGLGMVVLMTFFGEPFPPLTHGWTME